MSSGAVHILKLSELDLALLHDALDHHPNPPPETGELRQRVAAHLEATAFLSRASRN